MNRNEIELLLSHIEGLQKFLEGNTLEGFRQEILRVEKFLRWIQVINATPMFSFNF